jgi:hypothetical protein
VYVPFNRILTCKREITTLETHKTESVWTSAVKIPLWKWV